MWCLGLHKFVCPTINSPFTLSVPLQPFHYPLKPVFLYMLYSINQNCSNFPKQQFYLGPSKSLFPLFSKLNPWAQCPPDFFFFFLSSDTVPSIMLRGLLLTVEFLLNNDSGRNSDSHAPHLRLQRRHQSPSRWHHVQAMSLAAASLKWCDHFLFVNHWSMQFAAQN